MAPSDLYSEHAEIIEAALTYARRAHRLNSDAGEEFASWARLRLIDNDCAILRKFEGRSSLRTFLVTVVQRLFLDWRNAEWGKWRPTAMASRLGAVAIELERLIIRDQLPFGEAAELLVSQGVVTSRAECERVWAHLPQRPGRRLAEESVLANMPASGQASDAALARERQERAKQASLVLMQALATLPPQDQLIVRLRFHDGITVAQIAQLVRQDQKALYRRFDRLLAALRNTMQAGGVSAADISEVLAFPSVELEPLFTASGEKPNSVRRSKQSAGRKND